MNIEVFNGEIVDKITISLIKQEKIRDESKIKNVKKELESILPCLSYMNINEEDEIFQSLKSVNLKLWDIEDKLRMLESKSSFGEEFVALAREVYRTNDKRFNIKSAINKITNSNICEEKSYEKY